MSCRVNGKTNDISLTRGDTCTVKIDIIDQDGILYEPVEGDTVRFAMKQNYDKGAPAIIKEIPIDTMILKLDPEDTKRLCYGKYVYDVELTKANGDVDTFITKATLTLTEEVY